ncbi:MAG TPA: DUF1566 domain-containing protein [Leptospiraceae bacterium]|nr:DUF1566 domain-containing protein [Leptospiraceae bacterium]HMZ61762.1 DUF1566 domain-containing protein [Leptospiraceae bacterium]HNF15365.1 DUF1566 domain-containing protein [Leptospiraceae bacterium]HNI28719.1 DUF1566 domain-containing protein [Leptospiraceae bacterium]HNM01886.1 DUF1566 domain-containing protein [Leptospiraceae bacterium]
MKRLIFSMMTSVIGFYWVLGCSVGTKSWGDKPYIVPIGKLEWKQCTEGQAEDSVCTGDSKEFGMEQAKAACESLNSGSGYGGRKGWRLPTIEEQMGLVKCTKGFEKNKKEGCKPGSEPPVLDKKLFPNTPSLGSYWSSSVRQQDGIALHGFISYEDGHTSESGSASDGFVRCVRTVQ